ncbi:MAG: putative rRNA biosis protein rrp5 [Bacillus sp. (in: firmicutes)]|jgi:hypothetical protein|nr:putative rRNA biosis protein rrp5 [Bacillus sp. (in: firmicutes)]
MNITVNIQAPELVKAILTLATALEQKPVIQTNPSMVVEMKEMLKEEKAQVPTEEPKQEKQQEQKEEKAPEEKGSSESLVSLESVRSVLATLSQNGKQLQVKGLIAEFGAKKLTDIPVEKYAELLAAAEAIA